MSTGNYFGYFPKIVYDIEKQGKNQGFLVTNIIKRYRIYANLVKKGVLYYNYVIINDERPDAVSYKFYGKTDYDWLILLVNSQFDRYFDWPMSEFEFNAYITKTYGSIENALETVKNYLYVYQPYTKFDNGIILQQKAYNIDEYTYNHFKNQLDDITGLVSGTTGENVLHGVDTSFDTDLNTGDLIKVNGDQDKVYTVYSIESPTHLTIYGSFNIDFSNLPASKYLLNRRNLLPGRVAGSILTNTITGFGTNFAYDLQPGDVIQLDYNGAIYTVKSVRNHAHIKVNENLRANYNGSTITKLESQFRRDILTAYDYEYQKNEANRQIKILRPEYLGQVLEEQKRIFS